MVFWGTRSARGLEGSARSAAKVLSLMGDWCVSVNGPRNRNK